MSKPEPTTLHDPYPPTGNPASASPPPGLPGLTTGSNGFASPRAVPGRGLRRSPRRTYWIAGLAVLILGGGAAAYFFTRSQGERADVILHKVKKEPLNVTVTEKGTLESADNKDIVCKVRAGNKGFATSINKVIDDGTRVKPGDELMVLDDSDLKDKEENQNITVKKALADKVKAEKDYEIQLKDNEIQIAAAQNALAVAEIDLNKLIGLEPDPTLHALAAVAGIAASLSENGSYRQQLDDLTGQISLKKSEVEQNRERSDWAARMVKQAYMSAAQAQAEKSRLDGSIEALRSLESQKALLISYDRNRQITNLKSVLDNARRALDQAKLKAEALEVKTRIAKENQTAIYEQALDTLEDLKKQRKECKITAPDDILEGSMVVYFKPDGNRFGTNTAQGLIEQGAQVKEGQKMLRIPNLSRMQVNTKVHEAMVARIRGDVRVPTKIVEFTQVAMLLNTDPLGRMVTTRPEVVEKIREGKHGFRRFEYEKTSDGQKCIVKADSMPERQFVGHVRWVSAVASQTDSWISDVKLYQTLVSIDGELLPDGQVVPLRDEQLKPDMTAEVSINVDASKVPVLSAPIQAIIGGAEMGATREVFVKTAAGYERKPVTLGLYNEKMVEIRSGLEEGDEIVVNPKVLLGDNKTKTREVGDGKRGDKDKNGGKESDGNGYPGGGEPNKGGKGPKGGGPGGPKGGKGPGGPGGGPGGGGPVGGAGG